MTDGRFEQVAVLAESFEVHTGILKFDKRTRQYSVTIYHGHTFTSTELPSPIRIEPRPSLLPASMSVDDRAPHMILLFPAFNRYYSQYYIDDVRITERCPSRITRGLPRTDPYDCG